jgi:hypothetical protein
MGNHKRWMVKQTGTKRAWLEGASDQSGLATLDNINHLPDAEWRSMCALIEAAPEMLAVLKSIRDDLGCGEGISDAESDVMQCRIAGVLAKAEPPQKVKRRVQLTIEVEVEPDMSGDAYLRTPAWMLAVERVRDTLDCVVVNTKEIS